METEYQTVSKQNETFGNVIFSPNVIQETWTLLQEVSWEVTRVVGAPPWARPLPRGALMAPLTYFFRLYISIYPKNIREHNRSGVPPPEASVATETQSRPVLAPYWRRQSFSGGHLHHPGALHDEEGVVLPRG